jgi:Holliday junction DNA helicase RuvA
VIAAISGTLIRMAGQTAVIDTGGLAYEVLVPANAIGKLECLLGTELTLQTVMLLDGNLASGSVVPRLVGFLNEADRTLFTLLTRVRGISTRKALRAMQAPTNQIAAAIQTGDAKLLASLPELGQKSAKLIIDELRDEVAPLTDRSAPAPTDEPELSDVQRVAVDILTQWGDRRPDAQRWVRAAVRDNPELNQPEDIVKAAYRYRSHG